VGERHEPYVYNDKHFARSAPPPAASAHKEEHEKQSLAVKPPDATQAAAESGLAAKLKAALSPSHMKHMLKKYGPVAGVFHFTIWMSTLGGFYAAVKSGLDVSSFLSWLPFVEEEMLAKNAAAGQFAVAYAATMLTGPLRALLTISATPKVSACSIYYDATAHCTIPARAQRVVPSEHLLNVHEHAFAHRCASVALSCTLSCTY
jgi:Protein of unknown function (DUF1279)